MSHKCSHGLHLWFHAVFGAAAAGRGLQGAQKADFLIGKGKGKGAAPAPVVRPARHGTQSSKGIMLSPEPASSLQTALRVCMLCPRHVPLVECVRAVDSCPGEPAGNRLLLARTQSVALGP